MTDAEAVAQDFLRALRGTRSQVGFSRRLGFSTNVAYPWESGRRSPSMDQVFRACRLVKLDVKRGIQSFFAPLPWLEDADLETADGVGRLVRELRGDIAVGVLSERAGCSRFALSRWQTGRATPRLHEFFALVDASSGRLPDFVAGFVDPSGLPSLRARWQALEVRRSVAWQHPWCSAVLRALDLEAYRALPAHRPGWIAARIGVDASVEATCIAVLEQAEAIRWSGTHYLQVSGLTVDTRRSPDAGRVVQAHWARVGLEHLEAGRPGLFGYNVFTVSTPDLERLRQMHRAHYRAMRAVIAASERSDHVVVTNLQLFALDEG